MDPQEAPLFVRWDSNTLNTPYKSGQTTSSQGFALCYGELDKLQTAIAWAKGDYNVYVLNGVSGTTSGWKKLALKDDLNTYYNHATDCNNTVTAGNFICNEQTQNAPVSMPFGFLKVEMTSYRAWIVQTFIHVSESAPPAKYIRSNINNTGWSQWVLK